MIFGNRSMQYEADEYISGALSLYIDFVMLFLIIIGFSKQ